MSLTFDAGGTASEHLRSFLLPKTLLNASKAEFYRERWGLVDNDISQLRLSDLPTIRKKEFAERPEQFLTTGEFPSTIVFSSGTTSRSGKLSLTRSYFTTDEQSSIRLFADSLARYARGVQKSSKDCWNAESFKIIDFDIPCLPSRTN